MKKGGKSIGKSEKGNLPKKKMPLDNVRLGDYSDVDPIEGDITPSEDGLEKDPGDRLEFGFSFSAEEGRIGEEHDYYGDMTNEQKAVGNMYDPSLSIGRVHQDINEEEAGDIHISDEHNIGMAYGKDNYVDDGGDKDKKERRRGRAK